YLGRMDHQVKVRGYRIELGEIEGVLGQHSSIAQNVVVARTSTAGDKYIVAYLVAREGADLEIAALRDYLKSK
ncbi:MAG TPA: hypothetical protein VF747_09335, partial [Blastocatellia bacterium]